MKELLIIGGIGLLLYNATRHVAASPAGIAPGNSTGVNQGNPIDEGGVRPPKSNNGISLDIGPSWEDNEPREHPFFPLQFGYQPRGSDWAVQSANQFADWVGNIPVGYPHITGVVHVGGGGTWDDFAARISAYEM